MITAEEKLKLLVLKIENSSLSQDERAEVYIGMREGFKSTYLPVIMKNLSKEELDKLHKDLDHVTPDKFLNLIKSAFRTKQIYKDMDELLMKILTNYEATLKEKKIIE